MGVKKYRLPPIYDYTWLRCFAASTTLPHSALPVSLTRHFAPHVGRVNKFLHHLHASMRGAGLLTL